VNYDFLPTFVEWAGGDPAKLKNIDGVSLAGMFAGKKPTDKFRDRFLYFHYPHYRTTMPHSAIVSGTSKVMHFYERPDIPMLFDLAADQGEVKNIAKDRPKEHKKLYDEMMRYIDRVGARKPKKTRIMIKLSTRKQKSTANVRCGVPSKGHVPWRMTRSSAGGR